AAGRLAAARPGFGTCPVRDGAGLSRCCSFGLLSGSFASAAVRRSGESGDVTWLARAELNRSGVTVCACAAVPVRTISARHGKAARKTRARPFRPVASPALTFKKYPNKNRYLIDTHRALAG